MPEIPSPSRGPRPNVVTAAVVLLAILLAVVWLGSGGDAPPPVPAGLPVAPPASVPAAPEPSEAAVGPSHLIGASERGAGTAKPRHASRARGRSAPRPRRGRRSAARPRPGPRRPRERAAGTRHGSAPMPGTTASAPATGFAPAPDPEFAIG